MSEEEAVYLMKKGFETELHLLFDDLSDAKVYKELCWFTDRIAQHIHEICLIVSHLAENNDRKIPPGVFQTAQKIWVDDSLSSDWAVIESAMNARDTKVGRKNQVIFAMGQCLQEDFKHSNIEAIVREQFPVKDVQINVSAMLSGFANLTNPLIRRTPKNDAWRFTTPKLKMAIRGRLRKTADNRVEIASPH
jgi:hypothetical protein